MPEGRPGAGAATATLPSGTPGGPDTRPRFPYALLWPVPLLFVVAYLGLIRLASPAWAPFLGGTAIVLFLLVTVAFGLVWFAVAWAAARTLGVLVPLLLLRLLSHLPLWRKRVVISAPAPGAPGAAGRDRPGPPFLALFGSSLFFELVYVAGSQRWGALDAVVGSELQTRFFLAVLAGGCFIGLLLAPVAPYLLRPLRLRLVDTLELPLLWLTIMLLIVGGVTAAFYALFPSTHGGLVRLVVSALVYAPAAWYLALGFVRAAPEAQRAFLGRARRLRSPWFVFGRLMVRDDENGRLLET